LTTQAIPLVEKPSLAWIVGSATLTIVVSSTTISCTVASSTSAPIDAPLPVPAALDGR